MRKKIEKVIHSESRIDLDVRPPYYDDHRQEGGKVELAWKQMPFADVAYSLEISDLTNLLVQAKELGADRVVIAPHVDHIGYYFYFTKVKEVEERQVKPLPVNVEITKKVDTDDWNELVNSAYGDGSYEVVAEQEMNNGQVITIDVPNKAHFFDQEEEKIRDGKFPMYGIHKIAQVLHEDGYLGEGKYEIKADW